MFLGVDGVSDGLLGDLEQILIQRESPFYCFRILDADHSALGTAQVIRKDNLDAEIIPGFVEKTGQHPHTVEQLDRVIRFVNIAFRPPYSRCTPFAPSRCFGLGRGSTGPLKCVPMWKGKSF